MTSPNERALAPQSAAPASQVAKGAVDPEIIAIASALYTQSYANGEEGITKEQAVRAAYHFYTTGEVLGRDSYVGLQGKVKGQILEGYRAVQQNVHTDYQLKYRPLTAAESELHGIVAGDRALICELYLLDAWAHCRAMGLPYDPITGITVVRRGEKINVPNTKTEYWVLQKQARKDALRQVPGLPVTREEENGQALCRGEAQAAAVVAQSAGMTAPEQTQRLQATVVEMRGPAGDDPFGIDQPPPDPDREFDAIPSRGAELRAAAAGQDRSSRSGKPSEPVATQNTPPGTAHPAAPAIVPAAANTPRPWTPQQVAGYLEIAVSWGKANPERAIPNGSSKAALGLIEKHGGGVDGRRAIFKRLFGREHWMDLTPIEQWAVGRWAGFTKTIDGKSWEINPGFEPEVAALAAVIRNLADFDAALADAADVAA